MPVSAILWPAATTETTGAWPTPTRMDRLEPGATDLLISAEYSCALYGSRAVCWGGYADEPYLNRGFELGRITRTIPHTTGACAELDDGRVIDLFAAYSFRPGFAEIGADLRDFACSTSNGFDPEDSRWDVCRSREPGRYECRCRGCSRFAPAPLYDGFERISIGTSYACGLRADGTVACRAPDDRLDEVLPGANREWVDVAPIDEPSVHVLAGDTTACAVTRSGALWCWSYTASRPRSTRSARSGSRAEPQTMSGSSGPRYSERDARSRSPK